MTVEYGRSETSKVRCGRADGNPIFSCFITFPSLYLYGIPVRLVIVMDTVTVNRFRDNLKAFVEKAVNSHTPLKVTRRSGEAFVVMSADDWEREQETLYVLQNSSLVKQISDSMETFKTGKGYKPSKEELRRRNP